MTRNTMLAYLKNLRDLEVAKYKLQSNYQTTNNQYKQDVKNINQVAASVQTADYWEIPKSPIGLIIFAIFLLVFSAWVIVTIGELAAGKFSAVVVVAEGVIILALCVPRIYKRRKAIQHNKEEKRRLETDVPQQVQAYQQQLRNKQTALQIQNQRIQQEYNQVCQLLKEAYSLNVIPGQHRNLASIYYIYDYMSTSQATFEETLIHEHMENGIQRIMAKLDVIIAQNEELILHARRVEANTRETADNTRRILENEQQMLASMEQTEQNTADAAQAASVAAQYSAANAFFSAAQYIDSQRGR